MRVVVDIPKLKRARLSRLMTQAQLAAAASLSPQGLRNIEAGRASPHPSTIARLADALGIAHDQISRIEE